MIATTELRWVEREVNQQISKVPDKWKRKTIHVLQQKWVSDAYLSNDNTPLVKTEWRDVPLVKEGT
jgi:hypothetical protein